MTDLYIFRHGDTKISGSLVAKIFSHHGDTHTMPILPKSIPTLKKIGKYLKNIPTDVNFCSPYLRCVDSAKIAGTIAGKIYRADERIREFKEKGEKFSSFRKRVADFLEEIDKKGYSAVSICTHGAVIAALKHLKTHGNFFFFQVLDFPKPGNLIIIKNGEVNMVNFNKDA
jgi:broad specificity phosphatase PhoE